MFKKRTYIIFIAIFLLLLAAGGYVYLHFFYDPVETVYGSENELDQVYVQNGVLKIAVDPRIELLSSIELTGGYGVLGNLQFTYKEDMKNYFLPYKDHEAVRFFSKISRTGFSYDAPPAAMLYLSQPPSLRHILQYNTELKLRARGVNNLSTFTSLSRSFAADTGFSGFYSRNTGLYRQMVQNTSETLGNTDIVKDLEDYYGCSQNSYTIILSPLSIPGGYGIRTNENKGHPDIYAVIGPFKANSGIPVFDGKEIRGLVWHEFSHSFINPITADNKNKISKYSLLYKPLERIMKSQAYGSWEICVNEHLVRAVTTRLAFLKLGQEEGQNALREEKAAGFIYLDQLCKKLEEYEKNRSKYKSLKDFFPEILKCFENLSLF